ncbi:Holliday junction resolvase RuvX [Wielerella bovis]|uniref:Holliday junction resolvase RuvX n=1 Tax=Wielerella bovis TaxID=2917790 RepID=UPI002019A074|nr:Holliday junction resolvase RuvX [Wielerella bovis]MCG7657185.1 Holliday junction resolvase RuvX [Wielerella bovis]MCG7659408.1 Holliday junction resolvase RuvX [Wielerella bovis]ULJ61632.1 Holliday junction resolvase RuvX [Wielerella bovis]ULJ68359.1 Holliday junction resolvase RuvX [Wielerella bovis]
MPNFIAPNSGGCLAFDFGETRIGVAQGDCGIAIAHPIMTITGKNNDEKFTQIAKLIQEWQPENLVVGLPTHIDGTEHEMTQLARKFGRRLQGRFALPVYWVDERLSSLYAEELLRHAGVKGRKQKMVLDQVAAQAILHSFFESGAVEYFNGREKTET